MGKISFQLNKLFQSESSKQVIQIADLKKGREKAIQNMESITTVEKFLKDGKGISEAIYYNIQHLVSVLTEDLIMLEPLNQMHSFLVKNEDLYMPSYPPMSPITKSYYYLWTTFDAAFGKDNETVGTCILDLADTLNITGLQKIALQNFCQSRMGIYEIIEVKTSGFILSELVTNKQYEVQFSSNYKGRTGDLLFVRILPSLSDDGIYTGITTPYQLEGYSKVEWIEYFIRQNVISGAAGVDSRLYAHMKFNKDRLFWSEYVFYAYLNYRSNVVYLCGLPDKKSTQPCHDLFKASENHAYAHFKVKVQNNYV